MPRIHQLSPLVISKIAAGEVIERPASVVKELLENAVDAGASRIDIAIEQGGVELIRVVDNGCGIEPDDLPLALTSHATSKLADADDLFRVTTLGFRGEALASIGGVAQVTIQSRPTGAAVGAEVRCQGGELSDIRPWNGATGTRIEVRHLFYNTPVRRKFLRAMATEFGHVSEAVTRLALATKGLHIKLSNNGREVFELPGSAGLPERIRKFFGDEIADKLLPIDVQQGPVRLSGFIADPACNRGNNRQQYLFVNGRWIRDRSLGHAMQEAYHGLLMVGRYCVAFLFLDVPPDLVDVNVHPTKSEVRFRDSQAIYHLILSNIRARLRDADLTATLRPPALQPVGQPEANAVADFEDDTLDFTPASPTTPPSDAAPVAPGPWPGSATADRPSKAIQVHDAYLILETPEGMLVIDQHALHERILYEEWKERLKDGSLERQRLLVPRPVDLAPEQAAIALEHRAVLEQLGLGVEDFGGGTVLVTSYPALLSKLTPEQVLRSAIEFLTSKDHPPSAAQLSDDLLRMMACKAAVKAGDHLGTEEIAALVAQRHLANDTHHCPHGRPTALLFSKQELDRQFKRI